jgi:hypothetical protein
MDVFVNISKPWTVALLSCAAHLTMMIGSWCLLNIRLEPPLVGHQLYVFNVDAVRSYSCNELA